MYIGDQNISKKKDIHSFIKRNSKETSARDVYE